MATATSRPPGLRGYDARWSDATGTALVGPDGSGRTVPIYAALVGGGSQLKKVALVGDSLIATSVQAAHRFVRASGLRLYISTSAGVGGRTSAAVLAGLSAEVPNDTDVCIVQCGTNDALQAVSVGTYRSNINAIIDNLLSRGIAPIICGVPPNDTPPATHPDRYSFATRLLCLDRGIWFIDPWRTAFDASTGGWLSANKLDASHPNPTGQAAAAAQFLADYDAQRTTILLPRWNASSAGLFANSYFLIDTNVDGFPDGVGAGNSPTPSVTAGTGDVRGNWFKIAKSGTAAQTNMYCSVAASGKFSVGDEILWTGRVKVEGNVACMITVYALHIGGVGTRDYWCQYQEGNLGETLFAVKSMGEAGNTEIRLYFIMELKTPAATFDCEISVAEVQAYNLTTTRALA